MFKCLLQKSPGWLEDQKNHSIFGKCSQIIKAHIQSIYIQVFSNAKISTIDPVWNCLFGKNFFIKNWPNGEFSPNLVTLKVTKK
jgi:hypothetical protein